MDTTELRNRIKELKRAKSAIQEEINETENMLYKKLINNQLELFEIPNLVTECPKNASVVA